MRNILTLSLLFVTTSQLCAASTTELLLVPSSRAPLGAVQSWARTLSRLKQLRVRSGSSERPQPSVQRTGTGLLITAVIGADNQLLVPGKKFTIRQQAAIRDWIETQRESKEISKTAGGDRFGLTPTQLSRVHDLLKAIVTQETKDKKAMSVIRAMTQRLPFELDISRSARSLLAANTVSAELKGLSVGTSLAAVLRPSELVFVPQARGESRFRLAIRREESGQEAWPVGWELPQKERDSLPKLFDFLELEIYDTPIADVLTALGARLQTPVLYDEPLLKLKNLDPNTKKVSVAASRMFYRQLLNRALFNARMDFEVRVDERGKPLLWITPLMKK